jgi:hypothetical protein
MDEYAKKFSCEFSMDEWMILFLWIWTIFMDEKKLLWNEVHPCNYGC